MILTKVDWADRLQNLELTLTKLKEKCLKCNIEKLFFGQTEMEYLGLWVTRNGVKPINRKIESITKMKPPISWKEVRKFIGVKTYYRNMWSKRSHMLAFLTIFTSIKSKFEVAFVWDTHQCIRKSRVPAHWIRVQCLQWEDGAGLNLLW